MSTIDKMTEKIRENLSPMYGAPVVFWEGRLKVAQARLRYAQERYAAAKTPALKTFWEQRVKSAQKKVNYLEKRVATAATPGGMRPQEIADRWREAMMR